MTTREDHALFCQQSRDAYIASRNPVEGAKDWRKSLYEARRLIANTLRSSDYLRDISAALQRDGGHALVLRHLVAPPISQDQFKLICPSYSKATENARRPVAKANADLIAAVVSDWLSKRLVPWLSKDRQPSRRELTSTLEAISPLIAWQRIATAQRTKLSRQQEQAVVGKLEAMAWTKVASTVITQGASLPPRSFMHKALFASGIGQNQEVDIACGLTSTFVVAMECKVTNDETNSVKRINDVLKKANAWKDHWGNFIRTAALLQGVVKFSDVERLLDANIDVFWSHRLDLFAEWLEAQM
jgi:XamI restriction endonuclease